MFDELLSSGNMVSHKPRVVVVVVVVVFVDDTVHQSVRFVQIMRWWISNLRH